MQMLLWLTILSLLQASLWQQTQKYSMNTNLPHHHHMAFSQSKQQVLMSK